MQWAGTSLYSLCEGTTVRIATTNEQKQYPQGLPRGGEDEGPNRTDSRETTRRELRTLTGDATTVVCQCGKVCKNHRGMRIHQGKSGCQLRGKQKQRAGAPGVPGKTREIASLVSNHSAGGLSAPVFTLAESGSEGEVTQTLDDLLGEQGSTQGTTPEEQSIDITIADDESPIQPSPEALSFPDSWCVSSPAGSGQETTNPVKERKQPISERRSRIAWPAMNNSGWESIDEDLDHILETALTGPVDKKLQALPSIVYALAKERFGLEKKPNLQKAPIVPNRRLCEIKKLRAELRSLRKRYRRSSEAERKGLVQLREELRARLKSLNNAERLRRKRKEKAKKRRAFTTDPYRFTKDLLSEEKSGKLESSQEDVENYLREVHSDPRREEPLGECSRILQAKDPDFALDMKEPTWKEITEVVRKARSSSAPGPSGIPYRVYKKCPKLLRRLWSLLRVVWRKGTVPKCWQVAEGCLAPKEKNSKTINQFRTISLLSVEGKIFFSILAKRLTTYMLGNKYVDTSVQKGGIPGFSGCVEHTSALTQLLHEARIDHKDLTVVWLDLANAYGSIPHQLIKTALQHYHIPDSARNLIMSNFSDIHLRFSCNEFTTNWIQLEMWIVTGCTISVILFVMGMNMIIKTAERESRGPKTNTGIRLPSNRGFMDDMTVTTESHIQARWILKSLEETTTWARMRFKPTKSRSLVVKKGKVTSRFKLCIQNEEIPSLEDNPIKCLGKWFDSTLKDTGRQSMVRQQAEEGLRRIDKSELPGKFKAWIFQHGLLPRLMWPLMVNEIPISTVEKLEQLVSKHLRRWLGLPPSLTSIGLYCRSTKLQMPISSLVEEFKAAKARLLLTLRDSADEKINNAGIEVRTGRKWSVSQAVEAAESSLKHQDIVGTTNLGREGLGTRQHKRWEKSGRNERRTLVQEEIRKVEEQARSAKAVQLGPQGDWTKWNVPERKLTWSELWNYEPLQLSFLLRVVYDMLPTPTNLQRWKLAENPMLSLCERI